MPNPVERVTPAVFLVISAAAQLKLIQEVDGLIEIRFV